MIIDVKISRRRDSVKVSTEMITDDIDFQNTYFDQLSHQLHRDKNGPPYSPPTCIDKIDND